jgi:hypothetical protein
MGRTEGERTPRPGDAAAQNPAEPAPIGKADTPNVAGSDEQQPEVAEGPVPGTQPGEETGDPDRWRPPVEVDPPPNEITPPGEETGGDDGT